jgi:hypothetical protein
VDTRDERPVSGITVLLVVGGAIILGLLVLRWIFATITFLFNTALLVAVVAAVVYIYLKVRAERT